MSRDIVLADAPQEPEVGLCDMQETMTVPQLMTKLAERQWSLDVPEAKIRILAGRDPFYGVKEAKWIFSFNEGWFLDVFNYDLDQRLEVAEQEAAALRARLETAEAELRAVAAVSCATTSDTGCKAVAIAERALKPEEGVSR